jgi:hypothetical protein
MSRMTGPQYYPGAIQRMYESAYPGSEMETNTNVLHSTEGLGLPGYDGGASAPNFTFLPRIQSQKVEVYQHYRYDISSRALRNLKGGVETNTLNVAQVELVGTCDPKYRVEWRTNGKVYRAGVDYIFWPEAPDWALWEIAEFIAWTHEMHGVPLTVPELWLPYPSSYGNSPARMSFSQWTNFSGTCGHQHAAENDHGDPGNINIGKIMEMVRTIVQVPTTPPPTVPPTPSRVPAFPGRKYFALGQSNKYVTQLGEQLVRRGYGKHYRSGPGPTWSEADRLNVRDFQRARAQLRGDADGYPGPLTWQLLFASGS